MTLDLGKKYMYGSKQSLATFQLQKNGQLYREIQIAGKNGGRTLKQNPTILLEKIMSPFMQLYGPLSSLAIKV